MYALNGRYPRGRLPQVCPSSDPPISVTYSLTFHSQFPSSSALSTDYPWEDIRAGAADQLFDLENDQRCLTCGVLSVEFVGPFVRVGVVIGIYLVVCVRCFLRARHQFRYCPSCDRLGVRSLQPHKSCCTLCQHPYYAVSLTKFGLYPHTLDRPSFSETVAPLLDCVEFDRVTGTLFPMVFPGRVQTLPLKWVVDEISRRTHVTRSLARGYIGCSILRGLYSVCLDLDFVPRIFRRLYHGCGPQYDFEDDAHPLPDDAYLLNFSMRPEKVQEFILNSIIPSFTTHWYFTCTFCQFYDAVIQYVYIRLGPKVPVLLRPGADIPEISCTGIMCGYCARIVPWERCLSCAEICLSILLRDDGVCVDCVGSYACAMDCYPPPLDKPKLHRLQKAPTFRIPPHHASPTIVCLRLMFANFGDHGGRFDYFESHFAQHSVDYNANTLLSSLIAVCSWLERHPSFPYNYCLRDDVQTGIERRVHWSANYCIREPLSSWYYNECRRLPNLVPFRPIKGLVEKYYERLHGQPLRRSASPLPRSNVNLPLT